MLELTRPDGRTVVFRCCVEPTLAVVAGKWKLLILWHLRGGTLRFSELRRAIPDATQQMLIAQLRELEADEVVSRKVYAQVPPKVEYALTEFGRTLEPLLDEMCQWGETYVARMRAKAELHPQVRRDNKAAGSSSPKDQVLGEDGEAPV